MWFILLIFTLCGVSRSADGEIYWPLGRTSSSVISAVDKRAVDRGGDGDEKNKRIGLVIVASSSWG